jgi:hypothetical protein
MATLKKLLFFGEDSDDQNLHTHKVFITKNSVIISGLNDDEQDYDFIEISFEDWEDIEQFIYDEKKDNKI